MMKRQILNKTDVVTVDLKGDLAGGWGRFSSNHFAVFAYDEEEVFFCTV